ncbi:MAG: sugar phosphorylase [Chloroflexota bacterium]
MNLQFGPSNSSVSPRMATAKAHSKQSIYDSVTEQPALLSHMVKLYGRKEGPLACQKLLDLMASYRTRVPVASADEKVTERDTVLITYGDMVQHGDEKPLETLTKFLENTVAGTVSTVHVLPFYPWTSDDGFSVKDYRQVDPNLGSWQNVQRLGQSFRLMFDAVINHISSESEWFKAFLRNEFPFSDWFHVVDPDTDLTSVFRPRALPLLTAFDTPGGTRHVWTTFSADQVDLNYGNPEVMLAVIDILLDYVSRGADFVRLDAIGFMWKKVGTSCMNLPETHIAIQLIRAVFEIMAPHVSIITETNVPHDQNVSYFGNGNNEASMVYNFSLPPLTLHAFQTANTQVLTRWASELEYPSDDVTFFNFMASHDGIGITPARGLITDDEIKLLGEKVKALGGHVSYKSNPDGSKSIYELNISYLNALGRPGAMESDRLKADRFLSSQAIMLALKGVPGIYFHSLFGSESWRDGVIQTSQNRTINREKLRMIDVSAELNDIDSLRSRIFYPYRHMIAVRASEPAFDPYGHQEVFFLHPSLFCVLRGEGEDAIFCIQNATNQSVNVGLNMDAIFGKMAGWLRNILDNSLHVEDIEIKPYGILWLKLH